MKLIGDVKYIKSLTGKIIKNSSEYNGEYSLVLAYHSEKGHTVPIHKCSQGVCETLSSACGGYFGELSVSDEDDNLLFLIVRCGYEIDCSVSQEHKKYLQNRFSQFR